MPGEGHAPQATHYQMLDLLGKGGMGEVWRATDTRLNRQVAIKILPAAFAGDAARMARFKQEAQVLASLNHPGIATIHGVENNALVMELVEGPTLAERIAQGKLPLEEAVAIAMQIAEALDFAHERGIVHRDLKPANVKVTPEGRVKLLDFGLAKAVTAEPTTTAFAEAVTLTTPATLAGTILGTAAYMSPEQARGKPVDRRADIWAFGVVLCEMLTGRRPFAGDDITDILAAVVRAEPDFGDIPEPARSVIAVCLKKNAAERWGCIRDASRTLQLPPADAPMATARPAPWRERALVFGAGIVLSAAALAAYLALRPAPAPAPTHFTLSLPTGQQLTRTGRPTLAIAPDGRSLAYVADQQIYLWPLEKDQPHSVPGTNVNPNTPFFSPDGRTLGFYSGSGQLERIAVTGGAPVAMASLGNPYGADWYAPGAILVAEPKGIERVSPGGGGPQTLIAAQPGELFQNPSMLSDGDHVLFAIAASAASDRWNQAQIVVQSLRTGQRTQLISGGSSPRLVHAPQADFLVYLFGGNLLAARLNPHRWTLAGSPVPVALGIAQAVAGYTGAGFFAIARNGAFAAFLHDSAAAHAATLELADRQGHAKTLPIRAGLLSDLRISPNGRQAAYVLAAGNGADIWIADLTGAATPRRLTFTNSAYDPVWATAGQSIAYQLSTGHAGLYLVPADGSAPPRMLLAAATGSVDTPTAWSRDGHTLLYTVNNDSIYSVWGVDPTANRPPQLLVQGSPIAAQADLSPDGHWLAYVSNETGRGEIWVQPFPPTGAKYQVSTQGGVNPGWAPDGQHLFYVGSDSGHQFIEVAIATRPSFSAGAPVTLPLQIAVPNSNARQWDITPDGKQFLIAPAAGAGTAAPAPQLRVILHWFTELNQRVPH